MQIGHFCIKMTRTLEFRPARKVERLSDCLENRLGEIAMAVKMRPSHTWTKRPRGALLELDPVLKT